MNSISVGQRLWLEETALGATLNYRSMDGPEGVLFRVGMSYQSLQQCNSELAKRDCLWTIRDGSLSVYGDSEQLTLTFCSASVPFLQTGVSLFGEELKTFKWAIHAFASLSRTCLN